MCIDSEKERKERDLKVLKRIDLTYPVVEKLFSAISRTSSRKT